jgi:mannitol/fructose-specific phosphotransferase system IIA component (Ntr-type)
MSELERIAKTLGFQIVLRPDDAAHSMESAIRFLVGRLTDEGFLPATSAQEVISDLLRREGLGSTAFGGAIALPHAVSSSVNRVLGILARCAHPVPLGAPDGQPVRNICLILAPADHPGERLRSLDQIVQAMREIGPSELS